MRNFCAALRNARTDRLPRLCQYQMMENHSLSRLESLRPAIKARWKVLLGEISRSRQPGAVVQPEMLGLMIDDTLSRLMEKLRELPDRGSYPPVRVKHEKARHDCRCGLQLLMNYYLSGVRALRGTLSSETQLDRRHVCRCFNLLAREEVRALASVCRFRGSSTCGLRSAQNHLLQNALDVS